VPRNTDKPEYVPWKQMLQRCTNPRNHLYPRYGGRGIKVHWSWYDFDCFLLDMGGRPSMDHSLERTDNGGDYVPENCRWATAAEQAKNRRDTRRIEYLGETLCLKDWARRYGIGYTTLLHRLKLGLSMESALTTPVGRGV
jgi:hypothetical protein